MMNLPSKTRISGLALVAALIAPAALLAAPAPAEPLTLSATWQAARAHDPSYSAARAVQDAGTARRDQAKALWMPTVTASGGVGVASVDQSTEGAYFSAPGFGSTNGVDFRTHIGNGTATRWSVSGQQALWDAQRSANATTQRASADIANAQLREAEQSLVLRSTQSYFDVIDARDRLMALQRTRLAAHKALASAEARYQAGDVAVTDKREAEASDDAIAVQELDAQTAVQLAEAAFTDLTGLPSAGIGRLHPVATDTAPEGDKGDGSEEIWIERALDHSAVLEARRQAVVAAAAQEDRYDEINRPQIGLVAEIADDTLHGNAPVGTDRMTGRDARIGLQATLPLFTGGMYGAQRHEARALHHEAQAELAAAVEQVRAQARAAWLQYSNASRKVLALIRARTSAQNRRDATALGSEVGARTSLELMRSESDLETVTADLQRAERERVLGSLRLKAVAGDLRESDLLAIDAQLEFR